MDLREALQGNVYKAEITRREEELLGVYEQEFRLAANADVQQIEQLSGAKRALEETVERLKQLLQQAPQVTHIETKDHPGWFRDALETAVSTLIIVSPWIKMRVLEMWLPLIEETLNRDCEIWIGHGMPASKHHSEGSDEAAIKVLDELGYRTRLLYRVPGLGTHEKVLICDDSYIVTTSYNWLSFAGASDYDRYEHGIVHSGSGVSRLKEQFLRRLKDAAT
jgi:hypothetical protein